jgi:hypothetical protein
VDEFKSFESSMSSQISELCEMIAQLMQPKIPSAPPLPDKPATPHVENAGLEEEVADKEPEARSSTKGDGKGELPHWYSPNPPIPHPHINNRGDPPKLDALNFGQWQYQMISHMCSPCIELWRIVDEGFKAVDPNNLTRREVVHSQLNATALHMIQIIIGSKDLPHIQHFSTTKEAWQGLSDVFVSNESMKRTRYVSFSNEAERFFMKDGEDHQEIYQRLKAIATTFKNLRGHHIDDEWIKMKYIFAYMPFEPADLKSVQGKHNFHEMTSNQVIQEMQAYKVATQNAEHARAHAMGMQRSSNLALNASVVEREVPLEACIEARLEMCPKDMRHEYHEHMAFYGKTFWVDPNKAKEDNQRRSKSSGFQRNENNGQRVRICYNCNDRFHFVAECP